MHEINRIGSLIRRVRKIRSEVLDYFPGDYEAGLAVDGLHNAEKRLGAMLKEAYDRNDAESRLGVHP